MGAAVLNPENDTLPVIIMLFPSLFITVHNQQILVEAVGNWKQSSIGLTDPSTPINKKVMKSMIGTATAGISMAYNSGCLLNIILDLQSPSLAS